jgi:NCAIR mutase (PurE)-related protein
LNRSEIRSVLQQVSDGALTPEKAMERLHRLPVEDLGFAQIDHLRPLVQGVAEVVLCQGKTVQQVVAICGALARENGSFLATRASAADLERLATEFEGVEVNALARTVLLPPEGGIGITGRGTVLVVSAGTSDLPVAEEAAVVARALGNEVARLTDVGVAGIHRILNRRRELWEAAVVVVVAGMDGALASVVGGMVAAPVIAVPTSVGYGASFGGVAALLSMLNSCASGVCVVNIDNGFGAAMAASRINHGNA